MRWILFGLVWLSLLTAFVLCTVYLVQILSSPPVVQIASFKVGSEPAENIASYLVARADEIAASLPLGSLHEVEVPAITNNIGSEGKSLLGDAKLQIGGVDVSAWLRALSFFVPTTHHSVTGFAAFEASSPLLQLEWRQPDNTVKKSWVLTADGGQDDESVIKLLLDKALYRLFYYMHHDPKGPDEWRRKTQSVSFPNESAFQAYYAGRQRLYSYLHSFKSTELDQAERQFRLLRQEMPRFADGLMLLGVTLSEKREEVEAISIYDEAIAAYEPAGTTWANAELALKQAEDAFNKSAAQTKEEQEKARSALERAKKVRKDALQKYVPAQKMVQQAQLFKATALRKLFRWQDSHRALSTLQALEGKVDALLALPDLGELDRKDLSKIRLGALIEKSYILGQYLNLLNPPNFASALAGNETPEAVKPSDDVRDKVRALTPGHEGDPAYVSLRNTLFLAALSIIYDRHLRAVETAEQQAKQLYGNEPLNWTRESDNYVYQLHQTKGDGLYRRAQTAAKDDNEFKAVCSDAIKSLKRAEAVRPNHYAVLQSLARIYADPRFDPRGDHVDAVREFYSRSADLKPTDYYGHQQLAALAVREAYLWGPEFVAADKLKNALELAEKARRLRPGSSATFIVLAQLYSLQWAQSDPGARRRYEELVVGSLAAAQQVNRYPERAAVPVTLARLQWSFLQFRASEPSNFEATKTRFLTELNQAQSQSSADDSWEARDLRRIARELHTRTQSIKLEDRFDLRWPTT
jgi:hypothetical protein